MDGGSSLDMLNDTKAAMSLAHKNDASIFETEERLHNLLQLLFLPPLLFTTKWCAEGNEEAIASLYKPRETQTKSLHTHTSNATSYVPPASFSR